MIFRILAKKTMLKRSVAFFVAATFIFSNVVFADVAKSNADSDLQKHSEVVTDPSKIVISRDYGLVKSKFTGKDNRLVVHIQDAHCNYEAQSNIIKILEGLVKNDGLSLVSVEGADGMIDTSWFKAFPDADIRKEVADYFMKKGEITGPEFLSITTDLPIKLFGAETRSYYIQNLNAFTSSYPLKEDTEKYFNQIKAIVNKLKNYIYSDELKTLDTKSQDYESKKLQFSDYVKFLETLAQSHKISLRQYENLFKLVSVFVYEKKIDFSMVDKERSSLIDELTKKLTKDALTELVTRSLSFKMGKISSAEYYDYVKTLAAHQGFQLSKDYPNLFNYIVYNSVYSRIENEKLFNDIKSLETAVKEKIFANDDQRTLDKLSRYVDILLGLVNIKLLNNDFDYYKAHKDEFTHETFAGFIKKMADRYGLVFELDPPSDAIKENMSKLEDFYSIAIKRDNALVDNTLQAMEKEDARICVLVTGGFHSEGIAKLLEKQGISYMVVCPNITKEVETPYIKILTNQRTPLEEILSDTGVEANAKKSMLAPLMVTWALPLDEGHLRALLSDVPAGRINKIDLQKLIDGIVGRMSKDRADIQRMSIEKWIVENIGFAVERHLTHSADALKGAYLSQIRTGLADAKLKAKAGAALTSAEKKDIDRFVDEFSRSQGFDGLFTKIYEGVLSKREISPGRFSTGGGAFGKGVGVNHVPHPLINSSIKGSSRSLTVFENGAVYTKGSDETDYSFIVTELRRAIKENLTQDVIDNILRSSPVSIDPRDRRDPIVQAFTAENLLNLLRPEAGPGFKIKLIEPAQEHPSYRVPGLTIQSHNANYGHYSINNDTIYLPWYCVDLLIEKGKNGDTIESAGEKLTPESARKYIVTLAAHELVEYALVKSWARQHHMSAGALEKLDGAPQTVAHYVAQLFEKHIAGPSKETQASTDELDSQLDVILRHINREYLEKVKRTVIKGRADPETKAFSVDGIEISAGDNVTIADIIPDASGRSDIKLYNTGTKKYLTVSVIKSDIPGRIGVFCRIGNSVYKISNESAGISIPDLLRGGAYTVDMSSYNLNYKLWIGNQPLLDFYGVTVSDLVLERSRAVLDRKLDNYTIDRKPANLERFFYDNWHEPLNSISDPALYPEISPDDIKKARDFLKDSEEYDPRASASIQAKRLHYLAILIRSNAWQLGCGYREVIDDISVVTDSLLDMAVHSDRPTIRSLAKEVFDSLSIGIVRSKGAQRDSKINLTDHEKARLENEEPFTIENPEIDFPRLQEIAAKLITEGNWRPYILINITNFSGETYLAYMDFVKRISENYNGNITFIISVQAPNALPGDLAGGYTVRARTVSLLGDDFWMKERIVTVSDGGEKKRTGPLGIALEEFSKASTPDGTSFLEGNILTAGAMWLLLPGLGMYKEDGKLLRNYKLWLASDGKIRFGKIGDSLKKLSQCFKLGAFGLDARVISSSQMSDIARLINWTTVAEDMESGASREEALKKEIKRICEDPSNRQIFESMCKNIDARLLLDRGVFTANSDGAMTGFLEKGGGDKLLLIDRYINIISLAYQHGNGVVLENLWLIIEDSLTGLNIGKGFASTYAKDYRETSANDDHMARVFIGRAGESTFTRVFGDLFNNRYQSPWACIVARTLTGDKKYATNEELFDAAKGAVFGGSYGEGVQAVDVGNLESHFTMWERYVREQNGPRITGCDISDKVTVYYKSGKSTRIATGSKLNISRRNLDKLKLLLRNVRIIGSGELHIGEGVVIENSTIRVFDNGLTIPDGTKIIDSRVLGRVEFVGESAVLVAFNYESGRHIRGTSGTEAPEPLRIYGDETTTTQSYLDEDDNNRRFTVVERMVNSFNYDKAKLYEMVGGADNWGRIISGLGLLNLDEFKDFEAFIHSNKPLSHMLTMSAKNTNKTQEELWRLLATRIFTPRLSSEELEKARKEIRALDMSQNERVLRRQVANILKKVISPRFTKSDAVLFNSALNNIIVSLSRGTISDMELDRIIGLSYRQRAQPAILEVLGSVTYDQVKDKTYGQALYIVFSKMHPAIIDDAENGMLSWNTVLSSGMTLEGIKYGGRRYERFVAKIHTDSVAMANAINLARNSTYADEARLSASGFAGAVGRDLLTAARRSYFEGQEYAPGQVYRKPIPKFIFGTSGIRALVTGITAKLDNARIQMLISNGYGRERLGEPGVMELAEDFNLPNIGVVAKSIALYNLNKAKGLTPTVMGTTEEFAVRLKNKGLLVMYDNRPGALQYALETVRVLAAYGIKATLAKDDKSGYMPTPIPLVSLLIKKYGYASAITFTASHNGDEWNGIKFDTEDGAPAAEAVTKEIGDLLKRQFAAVSPGYEIIGEELALPEAVVEQLIDAGRVATINPVEEYINAVVAYIGKDKIAKMIDELNKGEEGKVSVVLSAFYGSAGPLFKIMLPELARSVGRELSDKALVRVIQAKKKSGDVYVPSYEPTLRRLPRLTAALRAQVRRIGGKVIFIGGATDNDADRFQVCEARMGENGKVVIEEFLPGRLTAILVHYLHKLKPGIKGPMGRSFVSSTYQDLVAQKEFGEETIETPAGFKHARKVLMDRSGMVFSEESYGLSFFDWTMDKDGILPILLSLVLVTNEGESLAEYNEKLRRAVGTEPVFYRDDISFADGRVKERTLELFRAFYDTIPAAMNESGIGDVPEGVKFAGQRVVKKYDVTVWGGMKLVMEDGSWVAVRSSGTEPLIRFYTEGNTPARQKELHEELLKYVTRAETETRQSASGEEPVALKSVEELNALTGRDVTALTSMMLPYYLDADAKKALIKDGPVMIVWDTGISDSKTTEAAQQAQQVIEKYLGKDAVIFIRGNGSNPNSTGKLLSEIRRDIDKVRAVITIAGDGTLNTDTGEGLKLRDVLSNILPDKSKVLDIQSSDDSGPLFVQVPALYNLALCIGFDLGEDKIMECLRNIGIAIAANGNPNPRLILSEKIVRILPRIRPGDWIENAQAQEHAREELEKAA